MTAPAGAVVGLYVDLVAIVQIDDVIQTQTGRAYLVIAVRRQLRGKHTGRWHLRVVVLESVPDGARVHTIRWYKRQRRQR